MNEKKIRNLINDSKAIGISALILSIIAINIIIIYLFVYLEEVQTIPQDEVIAAYEEEISDLELRLRLVEASFSLQNKIVTDMFYLEKANIINDLDGNAEGVIDASLTFGGTGRDIYFEETDVTFRNLDDDAIMSDKELTEYIKVFMNEVIKNYEYYVAPEEVNIRKGTYQIMYGNLMIATWEHGKITIV